MNLLDGKKLSQEIQQQLIPRINHLIEQKCRPGLGVILVGENEASLSYVLMKQKACSELGIKTKIHHFPNNSSQNQLIQTIQSMNKDPTIHGILIQLPLPEHIHADTILNSVSYEKDVDGFHIMNAGKLFQKKDYLFSPCTPKGCIELLDHYNIEVKGMNITIIGCSNIVGLPLSMLLLHKGATVTLCHIDTIETKNHCIRSDMVISCCGVPGLVKQDWIKEGSIVIDIGITKVNGKIVGDVDFENVKDKTSYITPVPGGVGPMTIAMLMKQTVEACEYFLTSKI